MAKRYTTFLHTKAMLNSKPNTTSAAGRYARSSMTNNVLQSKAMEKTFGADRNIHEAGKQACCLKTFSKSHSALQQQKDKIMFELCKHLHLVHVLIAKINGDALCAQSHVHPLISHWHVSSANSNFVGTNKSATKTALNPKSWVVYAMDTIPLIKNAQGSIQAGARAQFKHDKGRTQSKKACAVNAINTITGFMSALGRIQADQN